jgi:hypothetical protein
MYQGAASKRGGNATSAEAIPMQLDDVKTCVEIVQGIMTSMGILAAGIWSFYTFVLGRSFAPNVQISFEMKQVVNLASAKGAVVSVTIRNVGKTKVRKKNCWIAATPISTDIPRLPALSRIDDALEFGLGKAKVYPIFTEHTWLEPGEEAMDEVLFALGGSSTFKVSAIFVGHKKKWASSVILDAEIARQESARG